MHRTLWPLALILALTACGPSPLPPDAAVQPSDLTAEQLVAQSNAARGGEEKLRSIRSVKMTGTFGARPTSRIAASAIITPSHYLRQIGGEGGELISIKAVDGPAAWELNPLAGILKPEAMVPEDASRFRHLADPQGPLVDAQAKGNKVEVAGKLPWRGSQVYKLKVTFPDGRTNSYYLDAKSFLPVRMLSTIYLPMINREVDLEVTYDDFRVVDGVKWPFTEKSKAPEGRVAQTIFWKKIEVNPPVEDAVFRNPRG
ncbi:MAG TPA: hypothetical protein VEW48_16305 [Thermoanaerobaculia bacterium]|nr:hypothetical protein [Thermoanaerobaculia bacterium]